MRRRMSEGDHLLHAVCFLLVIQWSFRQEQTQRPVTRSAVSKWHALCTTEWQLQRDKEQHPLPSTEEKQFTNWLTMPQNIILSRRECPLVSFIVLTLATGLEDRQEKDRPYELNVLSMLHGAREIGTDERTTDRFEAFMRHLLSVRN